MSVAIAVAWWLPRRDAPPSGSPPEGQRAPVSRDDQVFSQYAGSSACKDCHAEAYADWATSHHGLAERSVDLKLDRAAFEPARSFAHGSQTTRVSLEDGRCRITTLGLSQRPETHVVERVIGVSPLVQYLVAAPGNRLQTLEASYDPRSNQWFNVFGAEDRRPGEWGHWTGRGMNWNNMCAYCHNTRLRKHYNEQTDSYATSMAEMGVSCEACHGPMKTHVEWQHAARDRGRSGSPDPTVKRLTRDQMFDACGTCHARRQELTGEFVPGDSWHDHFSLVVPDHTDIYYPDGQVRDENYEFAAFLGSRMHASNVRCVDCHQPHSAKTLLPGNALCMRCHTGAFPNSPKIDPLTHTFHKPESTGSQCVNCHMPQTTYMQRHVRHDHGFTSPDPLLTRELGIPNACNRCHTDQSVDWAVEAAQRWYGERLERPARARTRAIAAARAGRPGAQAGLLQILNGEESPYWKAAAARMLEAHSTAPEGARGLIASLQHSNALVRSHAAISLGAAIEAGVVQAREALARALEDPARSVRVAAAWGLRDTVPADGVAHAELAAFLDYNADQPGGQVQKGAFALARNRLDGALAHYQRAVAWDTNSPAPRHDLAILLSMLNRMPEAIEQLEAAARLAPNEAEYVYKLGLAYHETGDLLKTMNALETAVRIDPRHARAWYNLGLARSAAGQPEAALDALVRGESAAPTDSRFPYARATILARLGRAGEARAAALRALELDPRHAEAQALLGSLP